MLTLDLRPRGCGKTHEMIMSLPTRGAIVLVPNRDTATYLRRMIAELRGDAFSGLCILRTVPDIEVLRHLRLAGHNKAIRADHSFWENPQLSYALGKQVEWLIEQTNWHAYTHAS